MRNKITELKCECTYSLETDSVESAKKIYKTMKNNTHLNLTKLSRRDNIVKVTLKVGLNPFYKSYICAVNLGIT